MRSMSAQPCRPSQSSPSSTSRSSSSPKFRYMGQAETAPLPLAVRLSHIQTTTPRWARSWWKRYVVPPQAFLTTGEWGPP